MSRSSPVVSRAKDRWSGSVALRCVALRCVVTVVFCTVLAVLYHGVVICEAHAGMGGLTWSDFVLCHGDGVAVQV